MLVTPAILARDADDLFDRLFHSELKHEPLFHLDVLDHSMFGASSFADPDVIRRWEGLPRFELHLMVADPLREIEAWLKHEELARVLMRAIVHQEISRPIEPIFKRLEELGVDKILAVCPETPVDVASAYVQVIDELLIMGVHPGAAGRDFLDEPILAKVRRARQLFPHLPVALDGGVNLENIANIGDSGVSRCVASSALWHAVHPSLTLFELRGHL